MFGEMKASIKDGVVHSPHPSIEIPVCSFYALAKEKLAADPDKTALVDDVTSLSRAQLLAWMQRFAVGFRSHGVGPGDRVCVHLTNGVHNLVATYGCILAGASIVLAKPSLTERELRYQAEDSDSTHILTDVQFTEKVKRAVASLNMKGLFSMGRAEGFASAAEFSELEEKYFEEWPVESPRETILALCYTSGTTGLPKGVEITHYNYVACFYTSIKHFPWGESDVILAMSPITHMSGFFGLVSVLNGTTSVITSSTMTPSEIIDTVDKYQTTAAIVFPSQLQALVREMKLTRRTLPTMREMVVGGSVVQETLTKAAREAFADVRNLLNLYGMTESCGLVTSQTKTGKAEVAGTDVGMPTTMVQIKVVDVATRKKLGAHQIGEIVFSCPTMIRRYYKRPRETAELFDEEGWLKSGDAGYYDEDGRLYISERLKQMVKCMGNQVVPGELEELLLRNHSDEIAEVSVVGLPHAEYGEAPAAAVVLSQSGRRQDPVELAKRIKSTIACNLAVHKHLYGGVFFVDSIPKTETSKVNRPVLARSLVGA